MVEFKRSHRLKDMENVECVEDDFLLTTDLQEPFGYFPAVRFGF